MSQLTEQQINKMAAQIYQMIEKPSIKKTDKSETEHQTMGVFPDIDSAVNAAKKAFDELMTMSFSKRKDIISEIRRSMDIHAEDLARRAFAETKLGRFTDKVEKNRLVIEKTPGPEILEPVAFTGDRGLTLLELAPYGVIGAITPVTNPTSSIICNTIGMVSAGNAVVFNVHPNAKEVSTYNIILLNEAIVKAGGPPNLVTTVQKPTIESAQALMKHPGVRLLVVTGGAGVVNEAMSSGKRAICAGPGNPPVVVDETADIENAARAIVKGASMDNNIICVDEKEVFVVESVADQLIRAMAANKAYVLNPQQMFELSKVIFTKDNGPEKPAVMNKSLIGKNAQEILSKIGLNVPEDIRLAIVDVKKDHPLVWTEQMMPVLPIVRMPDAESAIEIAKKAEHGFGHSAIMHSRNIDNLSKMARRMDTSIFVKNGPALSGLGYEGEGYCSFSIASPTGEGITNPRSFSRERRCVMVDHFRIV
ncbi:MAG: aldehyde dehydrogenase EutE [Candidatus Marinimicrobia bacterium]|nr:aldehyde dehydrogenase EutE [Candidatus Neomarinimicrobiota bacterium]MBL7059891.1 aldehyde dehydrogenase EutE [Candidatus Neomarinimicrobiota bacterium]